MTYASDWTVNRSSSNVLMAAVGVFSTTYANIFGVGNSITVSFTTAAGLSGMIVLAVSNAVAHLIRAAAGQRAAYTGTLNTTMRVHYVASTPAGRPMHAGLFFMQQNTNVAQSLTSCYGFVWQTGGSFAVVKFNSSLTNHSVLASGALLSVASDTEMALRVSWVLAGGTVQIVAYASAGSMISFTSSLYSLTDTLAAFAATSAEGFGLYGGTGALVTFDSTSLSGGIRV